MKINMSVVKIGPLVLGHWSLKFEILGLNSQKIAESGDFELQYTEVFRTLWKLGGLVTSNFDC